jgi:hypothetical protein
MAPLIRSLGTRWRRVVSLTLYPHGEEIQAPIEQEARGEENLYPTRKVAPDVAAHSVVTVQRMLY